jgi:hypothetical protein
MDKGTNLIGSTIPDGSKDAQFDEMPSNDSV